MASTLSVSTVSAVVIPAVIGVETQDGGPMVSLYPARTLLASSSVSDLRDKVSGTTWALPGTWTVMYLNLKNLEAEQAWVGD